MRRRRISPVPAPAVLTPTTDCQGGGWGSSSDTLCLGLCPPSPFQSLPGLPVGAWCLTPASSSVSRAVGASQQPPLPVPQMHLFTKRVPGPPRAPRQAPTILERRRPGSPLLPLLFPKLPSLGPPSPCFGIPRDSGGPLPGVHMLPLSWLSSGGRGGGPLTGAEDTCLPGSFLQT